MQLQDRHLDEAEFCFGAFEAALESPGYNLDRLAVGPERRLWAHVDALVVTGARRCQKLLLPVLADSSTAPERAAAASLALAELGSVMLAAERGADPLARLRDPSPGPTAVSLWTRLLSFHDAAEGERRVALQRALQLCARERFIQWLLARVERGECEGAALAGELELLASLGHASAKLADYLVHDDAQVVRAAAVGARLTRAPAVLERLRPLALAKDPRISRAAVESALVHYIPGSWASALYWAFTDAPSPFRRRALVWVALLGDLEVHRWLFAGLEHEARRADTLWALGFCGRAAAVEVVMPWLEHEQYGPLAAEVVCAIAGLPFDAPGCWRRRPPATEGEALPPLAHDTLDGELVPKADEALPQPEPAGIRAWWAERRPSFERRPTLRYLGGRPMTPGVLVAALRHGPLRRAHVHALELTLRSGGQLQLPTRSATSSQLAALAHLPSLELLDLQRGLRKS